MLLLCCSTKTMFGSRYALPGEYEFACENVSGCEYMFAYEYTCCGEYEFACSKVSGCEYVFACENVRGAPTTACDSTGKKGSDW